MSNQRISVVVPLHNEAQNVELLASQVLAVLDRMGESSEIVFVNDASTDDTLSILTRLREKDPRIRIVNMVSRSGQSAAIWAGFRNARNDILVTMDGDLQNDPDDIPLVVKELESCDLACGWRVNRRDSFVKRVSSIIGNGTRQLLLGKTIHDTGCGLKAFKRDCALSLLPFNGMHRFFASLAIMQGYTVREVPVNHHERKAGKTKYGISNRAFRGFLDCLGVLWLERRRIGGNVKDVT